MQPEPWTLTARWIFPVDRPPLERGTVTIQGDRITAVESEGQRGPDLELGHVALLPGFVNAHTHLDLSGLRGCCPPSADFIGWLRAVVQHRRNTTPLQVHKDILAGIAECCRFGTTLVGDISSQGQSWPLLARAAPLRAVAFLELLGLTAERALQADNDMQTWLVSHLPAANLRPGLSPHAPYSVRKSLFMETAKRVCQFPSPVAIHLAETSAELELLQNHTGPLVAFLSELGAWDAAGLVGFAIEVVELFRDLAPVLWIHGNYLDVRAMPTGHTIVYCPRSHQAFGHPPHPFREFLAAGTRVALGTDSLASNPDLDVLAEARFLHRLYPDMPGAALLRMATLSGAEALGWDHETGSLTPGKSADLVVLPLPEGEAADPYSLVLDSSMPVTAVMFRGSFGVAR